MCPTLISSWISYRLWQQAHVKIAVATVFFGAECARSSSSGHAEKWNRAHHSLFSFDQCRLGVQ